MALFTMRDSWNVWRRKVNEALGGNVEPVKSEDVTYDNTDSGLTATNVQSAIDEIDSALDTASDKIETLENALDIKNVAFTLGSTVTNAERCRIVRQGDVITCNLAFSCSTDYPPGTEVLTITNNDDMPLKDAFCAGVSMGKAFAFKLSASNNKITIEQLTSASDKITANSGIFGTLTWVAGN